MMYVMYLKIDKQYPPHVSRLSVFMCEECGALVCEDQKEVHEAWHKQLMRVGSLSDLASERSSSGSAPTVGTTTPPAAPGT